MGSIKKYTDKLYLKQWGLGYLKASLADIIRQKKSGLSFNWLPMEDTGLSWADPFVYKGKNGNVNILFESVSTVKLDGNISLLECDADMNIISSREILNNGFHLSYPFIYQDGEKTFVLPENAFCGSLNSYELQDNGSLINQKQILSQPVIDPTILKANGRYWLFCTMLGEKSNSDLFIFYSDTIDGTYMAHPKNPVKSDLNGSRPAGAFIEVDGHIYRPAQNCANYYGESITINRIEVLTTTDFAEEAYMTIEPNQNDEFNYGIHTINAIDNLIIVDGQKSHFQPVQQLSRKLKNIFN